MLPLEPTALSAGRGRQRRGSHPSGNLTNYRFGHILPLVVADMVDHAPDLLFARYVKHSHFFSKLRVRAGRDSTNDKKPHMTRLPRGKLGMVLELRRLKRRI
jgi:hypothetical protein